MKRKVIQQSVCVCVCVFLMYMRKKQLNVGQSEAGFSADFWEDFLVQSSKKSTKADDEILTCHD